MPAISRFAASVKTEGAFAVLAVARRLAAAGKDVIELEIGDSPFPDDARGQPRPGCRRSATTAATTARRSDCRNSARRPRSTSIASTDLQTTAENIVAGPGGKTFEQFFCETFLDPGDGVLVFSPYFPDLCAEHRPPRRPDRSWPACRKHANFARTCDDVERF